MQEHGSREGAAGWRDGCLALALSLQLACAAGSAPAPAAGSGALPEFAAPQGRVLPMNASLEGDLIAYRPLTRADFRGGAPPPHLAPHREKLGAATCAYVVASPETRIRVDPVVGEDGAVRFHAAPQRLGFRALMDRDCSWWNTRQKLLPEDYVLEHEQIHFALFELAARRLDAESAAIAGSAVATRASPQEAVLEVQEALQSELSAALETALERNRRFDEDTSMGFQPARQEEWLRQIRRELERTER